MADDRGRDDAEVRFTAPVEHIRVLDGVCHGTGMDRTNVLRMILREWSEKKLHEATILLRVAGRNATSPADDRQKGGK